MILNIQLLLSLGHCKHNRRYNPIVTMRANLLSHRIIELHQDPPRRKHKILNSKPSRGCFSVKKKKTFKTIPALLRIPPGASISNREVITLGAKGTKMTCLRCRQPSGSKILIDAPLRDRTTLLLMQLPQKNL